MKLYGTIASPFVQRVLIAARAKGHDLPLAPIPGGSLRSAEMAAISPLGRIPLLALDGGAHLSESDAIVQYLDEVLPGPPLLPADPLGRARVREINALATLECATGMRPLMTHLVFGIVGAPGVVDAARAQAEAGWDALDRLLADAGDFAVGAALTSADCALVPILVLAEIIAPIAGTGAMIAARPAVARYGSRIAAHPLVQRTAAEMGAGFQAMAARGMVAASPAT